MHTQSVMCLIVCLAGALSVAASETARGQVGSATTDASQSVVTERDQWRYTQYATYQLAEREVRLQPQAEFRPSLGLRLIANQMEMVEGNAAIHYLAALGFAEQHPALEAMLAFNRESRQAVDAAGDYTRMAEPYVWLETSPDQLPLERVREYLQYSRFQTGHLQRAALRERCDFDRNVRGITDPQSYLLPEVQAMRELARLQSIRMRVAIAEKRSEDAVQILGQQLAMGRHLGQDVFLVTNLVGIAIANMGLADAVYLCEQPDSPNLYWALAALPQPLVSMQAGLDFERDILFAQIPWLREVDETPQPAAYWRTQLEQSATSFQNLGLYLPKITYTPAGFTALIAAAYPGARLYLLDEMGMEVADVEALPVTQTVLLAVRRSYEHLRDELFKRAYAAYPESQRFDFDKSRIALKTKYGLIIELSEFYLPGLTSIMSARARLQQLLALLQTIESLRDYMAGNGGRLPAELNQLRLPAPHDPVTGQPFDYRLQTDRAILSGAQVGTLKYQLHLTAAAP